LEAEARVLQSIYDKTGSNEILLNLIEISNKMSDLGIQGQTVTRVGDLQPGFILGSKDVKFSKKLETLAKNQNIKLTDDDYAIMLRADNIINPPKEIMQGDVQLKNRGGMMSIFDMTRPLNAQR
jgi:hypothetical protein